MRQSPLMLGVTFMLMFGAQVAAASGSSFDVPIELVKPEVAAARVAACGFKSTRPRFDHTRQEDVIEILDVTSAPAKQLRCVAIVSLVSHYYVVFPASVYVTYERLYWRMWRERDKADARAWLKKRGLLSRLPTYYPKQSDEIAFAHTLESLCGPKAAGTLQPVHGLAIIKDGALDTFRKGAFSAGKLDDETLRCLLNAATASGYPLGFVSNELYQHRP
jgi:hypothetical protein